MTDEIVAFLLEPERLKLAVELVPKMEAVKEHILEEYWKNVRVLVDRRLSDHALQRWEAFGPTKVLEDYSAVGIVARSDLSGREGRYRVIYECLAGTKYPAYLGAKSGLPIGAHAAVQAYEQGIKALLEQQRLKMSDRYWLGWQYIGELGLPAITPDLAVLVVLNDDNRRANHPVADQAAQLLWDVFSSIRELLEKAAEGSRSIQSTLT
jgi:hypothetical protein